MIKVAGTDKPVSFITNEQNATQKKYFAKEIGCFQYGRCTGPNWSQVENADPFCTDEKTTANECPAKVITRNFRTNTDPATTGAGKTFADLRKSISIRSSKVRVYCYRLWKNTETTY